MSANENAGFCTREIEGDRRKFLKGGYVIIRHSFCVGSRSDTRVWSCQLSKSNYFLLSENEVDILHCRISSFSSIHGSFFIIVTLTVLSLEGYDNETAVKFEICDESVISP